MGYPYFGAASDNSAALMLMGYLFSVFSERRGAARPQPEEKRFTLQAWHKCPRCAGAKGVGFR